MSKRIRWDIVIVAIVVAGCVLLSIGTPYDSGSRIASGERFAAWHIRELLKAEQKYRQTYPQQGYACAVRHLGSPAGSQAPNPSAAGLIDDFLAAGVRGGYIFEVSCSADHNSFSVTAIPREPGVSGVRTFCSDQTGVIRFVEHSDWQSQQSCLRSGKPL